MDEFDADRDYNFVGHIYEKVNDPRCGIGPGKHIAYVRANSEADLRKMLKGINRDKYIVKMREINVVRKIDE